MKLRITRKDCCSALGGTDSDTADDTGFVDCPYLGEKKCRLYKRELKEGFLSMGGTGGTPVKTRCDECVENAPEGLFLIREGNRDWNY